MYTVHDERVRLTVLHEVYGYLSGEERGGATYCWKGRPLMWDTAVEALKHLTGPASRIAAVEAVQYSCDHDRHFSYTIGHGKNKGKWVSVCTDCGRRSNGRPKTNEATARDSLLSHPTVMAWRVTI